MNVFKQLLIYIYIIVLISFFYFLKTPVRMSEKKYLDIKSFYPDVKVEVFDRDGWKGIVFYNLNLELLIVNKYMSKDEAQKIINSEKNKHKIFLDIKPFTDSGVIVFQKKKKTFSEICIFYYKDRIYWVSYYTSLPFKKYYAIMKKFLVNMSIDGLKVSDDFVKDVETFKIPTALLPSDEIWLFIISSIFLFILLIITVVFQIGFLKPKDVKGVLYEEKVIVTAKEKFRRSNFPAYVFIKGEERKLFGYLAGKKIFEVDLEIIKMKDKKIIFNINGVEFSFNTSKPEILRSYISFE